MRSQGSPRHYRQSHGHGAWKSKCSSTTASPTPSSSRSSSVPRLLVLATTNLNGDYISDAADSAGRRLGIAPGANIGDGYASLKQRMAPRQICRQGRHQSRLCHPVGRHVARLHRLERGRQAHRDSLEKTILQKFVTYDFERQTAGATKVSTSEFATRIIGNM